MRHVEWGESPRESVTVKPPGEDQSDTRQPDGFSAETGTTPLAPLPGGLSAFCGFGCGAFFCCVSTGTDGAAPGNNIFFLSLISAQSKIRGVRVSRPPGRPRFFILFLERKSTKKSFHFETIPIAVPKFLPGNNYILLAGEVLREAVLLLLFAQKNQRQHRKQRVGRDGDH